MKKLLLLTLFVCFLSTVAYAQESQVGRYQIVMNNEGELRFATIIRIDTVTGTAWKLDTNEGNEWLLLQDKGRSWATPAQQKQLKQQKTANKTEH